MLESKENERRTALHKSAIDLEKDKKDVIEFVGQQDDYKRKKEEKEKELTKEKQQLDERSREVEQRILGLRSEIDKNGDLLDNLKDYKKFMQHLTPA